MSDSEDDTEFQSADEEYDTEEEATKKKDDTPAKANVEDLDLARKQEPEQKPTSPEKAPAVRKPSCEETQAELLAGSGSGEAGEDKSAESDAAAAEAMKGDKETEEGSQSGKAEEAVPSATSSADCKAADDNEPADGDKAGVTEEVSETGADEKAAVSEVQQASEQTSSAEPQAAESTEPQSDDKQQEQQQQQETPQSQQEKPQPQQEKPQSQQEKPQSQQEKPQSQQEKSQSQQEKPQSQQEKPQSQQEKSQPQQEQDDQHQAVLNRLALAGQQKTGGGGGGWGSWSSWGSSLFNTAATSLHTFTDQVSGGVHSVVETFEASVGAPPADQLDEDLSAHVKEPSETVISSGEDNAKTASPDSDSEEVAPAAEKAPADGGDWLHSWGVSSLTSTVQNRTKGLVESGLGVLETIGKKTMESLKETDPGYKRTKGLLKGGHTSLSQLIREAKEESEKRLAEQSAQSDSEQQLANYNAMFDQHKGLVYLEALELLSVSCTSKLDGSQVTDGDEEPSDGVLTELAEKFSKVDVSSDSDGEDNPDEVDFVAGIDSAVTDLGVTVNKAKLLDLRSYNRKWLDECQQRQDSEKVDASDIHSHAVENMAKLTAATIEVFHKFGQVLLLPNEIEAANADSRVVKRAEALISIRSLVGGEMCRLSNAFTERLNKSADDLDNPEAVNALITDVFLEAGNSTSYITDAFRLLLPVLQYYHQQVTADDD